MQKTNRERLFQEMETQSFSEEFETFEQQEIFRDKKGRVRENIQVFERW